MDLSPSTWRFLGLNVALGYIGLGSTALFAPEFSSKIFSLHPSSNSLSANADSKTPSSDSGATAKSAEHPSNSHLAAVKLAMILLGARDISIGLALLWFDHERQVRPMGQLICTGYFLCAVDYVAVWMYGPKPLAAFFAFGANVWLLIGLKFLNM